MFRLPVLLLAFLVPFLLALLPQTVLAVGAPTLSSPGNSASLPQTTEVTLRWNSVSGATQYKVELWGGPYSTMTPCNWQSGTSCRIGQMWPGTMYWKVKARDSRGQESGWSDTWSFTIQDVSSSPPSSSPPSSSSPASPVLASGVSLSATQVNPGDRIEGSITVRNNGGQDWRPQRLGIGVKGPTYLDFGWRENLTIRPGDSYTFQGAVPNAPDVPGTYTAYASWQDGSGNWHSLGGDASFRVVPRPPPGPEVTFSADAYTIQQGQCTYIRWTTSNATSVDIDGTVVSTSGSMQVCPTVTKHYSLNAVGSGGQVSRSLGIVVTTVGPPPPPPLPCTTTWAVGNRVCLGRGTRIYHGPTSNLDSNYHTTVPEDNWPVIVIGGPRNQYGWEWWDTSRREIDGGGTGWLPVRRIDDPRPEVIPPDGTFVQGSGPTVFLVQGQRKRPIPDYATFTCLGGSPDKIQRKSDSELARIPDGSTAQCTLGPAGVTLYEHAGYGGASINLTSDVSLFPSQWNDKASSIRVSSGWWAIVYEHANYQGRCQVVTSDIPNLVYAQIGNDAISSLKVGTGSPPSGACPSTTTRETPHGGVTLYEHANYTGASKTFTADAPDLRGHSLRGNLTWNDQASSIRVSSGAWVIVYEHINYGGRCQVLTGNVTSLLDAPIGNDTISSLKVGTGSPPAACPVGSAPGEQTEVDPEDEEVALPPLDDGLVSKILDWIKTASDAIIAVPDLYPGYYDDALKYGLAGIAKAGSRINLIGKVSTYGFDIYKVSDPVIKGLTRVERALANAKVASFAKGAAFHLKRIAHYGLDNIAGIEVSGAKGAYRFDIVLKDGTLVEVKSWSNETLRYKLNSGKLAQQLEGYLSQGKPVRLEFEGRMDPSLLGQIKERFPQIQVADGL
jgi:hypothetical protein